MRHLTAYMAAATMAIALASCDEGRIYGDDVVTGEEGGSVRLTVDAEGLDTWPAGYTLAVAGFADGNEYALVSKDIRSGAEGGKCDVTLGGISADVATVELCAIDRLRRRVATFHSVPYDYRQELLQIELPATDVSMTAAVQQEIFNTTCTNCHGGSAHAAANLNLTAGKSHDDLVMKESVKMPGSYRVKPGDSGNSVLYRILAGGESSGWNYDHSVEVVRQEKLDLIRDWIDGSVE